MIENKTDEKIKAKNPIPQKAIQIIFIVSNVSSGVFLYGSIASMTSPNKKTKDGKARPSKMELIIPTIIKQLSLPLARDFILLNGTVEFASLSKDPTLATPASK